MHFRLPAIGTTNSELSFENYKSTTRRKLPQSVAHPSGQQPRPAQRSPPSDTKNVRIGPVRVRVTAPPGAIANKLAVAVSAKF